VKKQEADMRDDFTAEVKDVLAKRVGMRCSNPNCRQTTSGPRTDPSKAVNVGVAAHITAASKRGPRFDPRLCSEERAAAHNGIWLCQNCAKLVDNDEVRFPVGLLRRWKQLSEEATLLQIECPATRRAPEAHTDESLVRFYAQCFDRPAFQDPFMVEGSMEAFDRAMEDTITAINTGCLRSRDGGVLSQARGKSFLTNPEWRDAMDTVVDMVRAIRSRYEAAVKSRAITVHSRGDGDTFYCINDREVADWMDSTRAEILRLFGEVASQAGVRAPVSPRAHSRRW